MHEDVAMVLEMAEDQMKASIQHLDKELLKIRAGKANPVMLNSVRVDYYGAKTPINQVSSVVAEDARTLKVTPFDRSALAAIERGIVEANLGLNPQNDGSIIRIAVPMLTGERRKELVRQAKSEGESAKISIRNCRRDHISQIKALKDDGVSEDQIKRGEDETQKLTDKFVGQVDDILKRKEEEITTI